ncbi:GIY-YIG nuclease family protein [Stenotrophomonas maltophilia]|uniref:GIY-YIG nuclease family protein n=1 Tax=Stenotrophomonas maltophilia TaxID=40324 RepID=UPI0012FE212F
MQKRKYGRNQKYLRRERHLYALVFKNENAIYVGQTVELKRRHREHELQSGWNRHFEMVPLGSISGNHFDAEKYEFAWRLVFHRQNWRIYGTPPAIVLRNPARRATIEMKMISRKLKAPDALHRGQSDFSLLWNWKVICGIGFGLVFLLLLAQLAFSFLFVQWQ